MRKRIISIIMVVLLFFTLTLQVFATELDSGTAPELAPDEDTEEIVVEKKISNTTVEYDFAHVFCGKYDVTEYVYSASSEAKLELIALAEAETDDGYELYAYIYTPTKLEIEFASSYIQLTVGSAEAKRVGISAIDSVNGLVHKVKLDKLVPKGDSTRLYRLSDVELKSGSEYISGKVNKQYKFFKLGEVLNCSVSDIETIELEASHTSYRVNTEGEGKYTDIQSVYFTVDNEYFSRHDMFKSINVTWKEYEVPNVLIVDSSKVAEALKSQLAEDGSVTSSLKYGVAFAPYEYFNINFQESPWSLYTGVLQFSSYGAELYFNPEVMPHPNFYVTVNEDGLSWDEFCARVEGVFKDTIAKYDEELEKMPFILYSDAEEFTGSEALLLAANEFLEHYDLSSGLYDESIKLVSDVTNRSFTVHSTEAIGVYSVTSLFEQLLAFKDSEEYEHTLLYKNLVEVDQNDIALTNEEFAEKYLVALADVENIKAKAQESDTRLYLLRYAETSYSVDEAWVIDSEDNSFLACNAFGCNNTYIEGFDTLQLTFTNKGTNGEETYSIYEVNSSPTEYISEFTGEEKVPALPDIEIGWAQQLMDSIYELLRIVMIAMLAVLGIYVLTIVFRLVDTFGTKSRK